jgi:hypothetical protein
MIEAQHPVSHFAGCCSLIPSHTSSFISFIAAAKPATLSTARNPNANWIGNMLKVKIGL